ncbi:hypothetical protein IK110_02925 [Candidatus Saccharibacteria bacterium]|nr:hypothetical protein [Candidatus Saccharibacteria bacterium]
MKSKERGNFEGEQPNSGSEWEALSNFEATEEKSPEQLNQERQERKLIAQILMPESNALAEHDVEISPEAEKGAFEKITSDDFTRKDLNEILTKIGTPVHKYGAEAVFNNAFAGRDAELMLLAQFSDHMGEYSSCSAQDVENFLKEFPSPADFESYAEDYVNGVAADSDPDVAKQFRQASENLKAAMYGKRQEYYDTFKGLEKRAYETERSKERPFELLPVEESAEIFHESQCDGDPLKYADGSERPLTKEQLDDAFLIPMFKIEVDNAEIAVSRVFEAAGHDAVIGYVKSDGKVMQRTFYKSGSQGTWHLMPEYAYKDNGNTWIGKGFSEEALVLPSKMQKALSGIAAYEGRAVDKNKETEAFYGTAKRYDSLEGDFRPALESDSLRGGFYSEINGEASVDLSGNGAYSDEKQPPESLELHGAQEPNLNALVGEWTTTSSIYGEMYMRCYKSADKSLTYTFCMDTKGHVWIGGVETNAPVNSGGVRSEWAAAGDFCTPPYEYGTQDGGYGDQSDKNGHYVGMWQNYLLKVPLIKRFLNSIETA